MFAAGKSCDLWRSVSKRTKLARNFVAVVARKRRCIMLMKTVRSNVILVVRGDHSLLSDPDEP